MARRPKESLFWKIVGPLIGTVIGAVLTYWFTTRTQQAAHDLAVKDKEIAVSRASELERVSFYERLKIHLDGGDAGFKNQKALRDRLVDSLGRRYGPSDMEYEPLFEKYFARMNGEERSLCEQMRGITTHTLYYHNSEIRGLLTTNPKFYSELSEFKDLREHLDLWISKYNSPFKEQKNQCLVYVGVAEEKPFPPTVGEKVQTKLSELQHSLSAKQ